MADLDLRTSRLHLRPVEPGDALSTAALMNDEIASNLTSWPPEMSVRQARARIAAASDRLSAREALDLAILARSSEQLFGWISAMIEGPQSGVATIGFWLGKRFQGQGLMTEAVEAIMPVAANVLHVRTIEAHIYPWNSRSIRLVRRLGFVAEGGIDLYSPVRRRKEEAFLYRRTLPDSEIRPAIANAA